MFTSEQFVDVRSIPRGEYVRRKPDAKTTFIRGEYDRSTKRYSLTDAEDINREVWVKSGTRLFVGFEY